MVPWSKQGHSLCLQQSIKRVLSLGCQATEFRAFLGDCLTCEEALSEDRNVLILWIVEDHLKGHTAVCWNVAPKCRTFLIPSLQRCEEGNL